MRILLTALSVFLLTLTAHSQTCPPRPAAAPKLVNNDICIGQPISVQNLSNANGNDLYYIWDWGDGSKADTVQNTNAPVHVYERPISDMCTQPSGGYIYKIKLTAQNRDANCLSHSTTTDAYAYFSPIADFIAPLEICMDNPEVVFQNTTCPLNTPDTQISWDFGDPASGTNNTSTQVHPRHTFTSVGTYTVKLTVTSFCNTSVKTMNIIVHEAPKAGGTFTTPTTTVCAPYTMTVNNAAEQALSQTWSVEPGSGWVFVDGTDATSANPVIRFTEGGEYIVKQQINSLCGTRDWSSQKIVVNDKPRVSMDTLIGSCVPFSIKPVGQVLYDGGRLPTEYRWTIIGGSVSSATTLDPGNITFSNPGTYPIKFKASNVCGSDSIIRNLAASDKIRIAFDNIKDTMCNSETSVQMRAYPTGGAWSGTGISPEGIFNPSVAGIGTHRLTYTYTFGTCSDFKDTTVYVMGTALSAGPAQQVCSNNGARIALTGATPVGGVWSGVGITDVNTGTFDPSVSGVGVFSLTYTYEDAASKCPNFAIKTVTVHQPPTATINSLPPFCINDSKTFTHQSVGGKTYRWQFGDGQSSSDESPTHAYSTEGEYTVQLMVTDSNNCINTASNKAIVSVPAIPQFTASTVQGCTPLAVVLDNTTVGQNASYSWDFGNGRNTTVKNPGSVIFENTIDRDTQFLVIMTATTPGCPARIDSTRLTVYTKAKANFSYDVGTGCSPLRVRLSNASTGSPRSFSWNFGNGITSTTEVPSVQTYYTDTVARNYSIRLIATNTCGSDTLSRQVTVTPSEVRAFFGVDRTEGCAPLTVNVTGAASYGAKIRYELGDGAVTNDANITHTYTIPGTYKIVQRAVGGACGQDSVERIINVWATPEAKFTYSQFNICKDRRVKFVQRDTSNVSVRWTFGDGAETGMYNPIHDYGRSGTFDVKFYIEDMSHGCKNADSTTIEVRSPLVFKVDSIRHSGCYGINTGAIVIQKGDVTGGLPFYEFSVNDSTFKESNRNGIFSNLKGRERYVVAVRDRAGCVDTTTVYIKGFPPLGLDAGRDREIDLGDSTQTFVTTNAYKPTDIKWLPARTVSCDTCENVWLSPLETTTYSVTAKGPDGCTEKAYVTVRVVSNRKVFIPNIFSPDGDGNNDRFYPYTARNVNKINYFRVFSRWGEMVYENKDFQPNEQDAGWDGKHNGTVLPSDVYVYVMEIELKNGLVEIYKGDVTLMR